MTSFAFRIKLIDRCTIRRSVLDHVTNVAFATDTGWAKGSEWTIGSGVATFMSTEAATTLAQDVSAVAGERYRISFDMTVEAGSPIITPTIGGVAGKAFSTAGSHKIEIVATGIGDFILTGTGSTGSSATIDNVVIYRIDSTGAKAGTDSDIATDVHCRYEEQTGREVFANNDAVVTDGAVFMAPQDVKENDQIIVTARGGATGTEFLLNPQKVRSQYDGRSLHHIEIDVVEVE